MNPKLIGSVERLAKVICDIFVDAIEPIHTEVASIKPEVSGINREMTVLKGELAGLKDGLTGFKKDVSADVRSIVRGHDR